MASIQEKLADSLSILKKYQDENGSDIIQGMKTLGETHTRRLIDNGYLEQVIKGWYMPTMPGMEGDTTAWYASYWKFIVAYSNSRFGDDWCLTPEESLDFYAGETIAPSQLIIRSTRASNNIVRLKHGDSMLDITAAMPKHIVVEPRYGLRLYPLAEALAFCSPAGYLAASRNASPHAIRIQLMWQRMRGQIAALRLNAPTRDMTTEEILSNMEDNYLRDSYHSLSIEGYRVTEALIERVRSGEWNPEDDKTDADRRNALAARGYYQAFERVKESVREIQQGSGAGTVVGRDFDKWHFEMFQPCITAGIIKPSDLVGYRSHQVYIRGSKHTPLSPDALRDAMHVFIELMEAEADAVVRAVLGHFFFVYIHPYMDGNGRTARFIMNVMLVTGGHPWRIITVDERQSYMAALEKASIHGDITDFAKLILYGFDQTANPPCHRQRN